MRGKKPKEREKYVIRLGDRTQVEVNREIYLEWYRSARRERYQKERDRKYGVCSLERLREKGHFSEKTVHEGGVTQEAAIQNIYCDKLRCAFKKLTKQEVRLIWLLYFEEITVRKAAEIFGCSRKSIGNKQQGILKKLRKLLE